MEIPVLTDTILPGYIEFIHSLVTARSLEQENFQEQASRKQDKHPKLHPARTSLRK